METMTISPKFQVVLPKALRKKLNLVPGQKVRAFVDGESIVLFPEKPMREARGMFPGINARVKRDPDRV